MISNIKLFKQLFIGGYLFLVTASSFFIIQIQDADELLILYTVPIIISVLYFRARIYLFLATFLALAGMVNAIYLDSDFLQVLETIIAIYFSTILASETIYKLNRRRIEAERKLRQMGKSKDKFFSLIAHDIKSPFSAFLGYTKILVNESESLDQEETKKIYRSLDKTAKNIYKLLENLLEWSRIQAGRIENQPDNLNLKFVSASAIDLFKPMALQKEVKLFNRVNKDTEVYFDENILNTALRNLISNSLKFTDAGGKISLEANETPRKVFLKVLDTGRGMSEDEIEKLFAMETVHSKEGTEGEKGSGFGLLITRELLEIGGAKIKIKSSPGKGSEFCIELPKKSAM